MIIISGTLIVMKFKELFKNVNTFAYFCRYHVFTCLRYSFYATGAYDCSMLPQWYEY
jgi:hypothetical protein